MVYRVALAEAARADANNIYDWIVQEAPVRGPGWFEQLIACLYSLEQQPYRCPLAREAREAKREIRCLLFGKRRHAYRILFEVDEARNTVWVLHIRHGALQGLEASELGEPGE